MTTSETKKTTREITNSNGDKVKVNIEVDFSNATREQIIDWALASRVISGQRVWRELSKEEIEEKVDGKTFDAVTIGHKIKSREDQIKATMNPALGIDRDTAEWIVDNPKEYQEMLDAVKGKKSNKKASK